MAGTQHLFNAKYGRHRNRRVTSMDISGRETLMTASAVSHLAKNAYNFRGARPLRGAPPAPSTSPVPSPAAVPLHHRGSFLALLALLHGDQQDSLVDAARHLRFVHHNLATAACTGRDRRWARGAPPQRDAETGSQSAYAPRATRFAPCSCHLQLEPLSPASSAPTGRTDDLEASALSTSCESKASELSPDDEASAMVSQTTVDIVAMARSHVRDHVESNKSDELPAIVPRTGLLARSKVTWIAVHDGTTPCLLARASQHNTALTRSFDPCPRSATVVALCESGLAVVFCATTGIEHGMLNFNPTESVQCVFWNRTVKPPTLLWCYSGRGATLRARSCPLPRVLEGASTVGAVE